MSIFRKESSPGRPPAPKLRLLRNRQYSAADSVAIRFNASSFNNEDNLEAEDVTLVTRQFGQGSVSFSDSSSSSKVLEKNGEETKKETQQSKEYNKKQVQKVLGFKSSASSNSKSAPVSQVTTPDMEKINGNNSNGVSSSTSAQPISNFRAKESSKLSTNIHEEEKSIFSGFKEKFHEKMQSNLTAVIGKIEEFSGESGIGEALERRLRKDHSFDNSRNPSHSRHRVDKTNGFSIQQKELSVLNDSSRSRHSSASGSDVFEDFDTLEDSKTAPRSNSVVMLDDFCSGPLEEAVSSRSATVKPRPSSTSEVSDLHHVDQSKSSKFSFSKKWHKKEKKGSLIETSHSVPVSMSALLSQKEETVDLEDELIGTRAQKIPTGQEDGSKENITSALHESQSETVNPETPNSSDIMDSTNLMDKSSSEKSDRSVTEKKLPEVSPYLSRQNVISAIIALIAYIFIPLPSYISGMVAGAILASFSLLCYQWLTKPAKPIQAFIAPDVRNKLPLRVPEMRESKNIDGKFQGWMNELSFYDPSNYHIGNTKSIYVQLEATNLRLQTPKQGIPKRAMWTDPSIYPASFMKQRFFDLTESKITLLPDGLVSKRLWSKKYPICITLAKKGQKCNVIDPKEHSSVVQSVATNEAKNLGYDMLSPDEMCNVDCLYLFARTCREKEEWYHRFVAATKSSPLPTRLNELISRANTWQSMRPSKSNPSMASLESSLKGHNREDSFDSNISDASSARESELYSGDYFEKTLMEYIQYMTHLVPAEDKSNKKKEQVSSHAAHGSALDSSIMWGTVPVVCEPSLMWLNAALGRLFFDFLREQYWADKVRDKIQRKLSKIHVPYFIDELTVTGIDLGSQVPVIQRTSRPYLDDRGLWLDIDIAYGGGFTMSLETKVNLMKLKRNSEEMSAGTEELTKVETHCPKGWAVTDSGEEDSAESSTDEEEEEYQDEKIIQAEPAGKKFLKIVDRIAQSKYFQQATENKYIKKAMEGVSNTRLMLTVEMKSCVGTMALNIPPPPTDRLWYGFRTNPHLILSAKPRVGHRKVSIVHVTEWIEKKLASEFQRVLVMPNMDDLLIPVLCNNIFEREAEPTPPEEAQEAGELHHDKDEFEDDDRTIHDDDGGDNDDGNHSYHSDVDLAEEPPLD